MIRSFWWEADFGISLVANLLSMRVHGMRAVIAISRRLLLDFLCPVLILGSKPGRNDGLTRYVNRRKGFIQSLRLHYGYWTLHIFIFGICLMYVQDVEPTHNMSTLQRLDFTVAIASLLRIIWRIKVSKHH